METRKQISFHLHKELTILLIFFAGCVFHSHGFSSPSEVGRSGSSDSKSTDASTFSSFTKYIMKSYFDRYESLHDSNFQEFIEHELPSSLCELLPDNLNRLMRPSVVQHTLISEGSHRHLSSSIRLHVEPEGTSQLPTHSCEVIFIERLPLGVFADPFELQHLHQRGVFTDVAVFGDTNLELPSFLSNRTVVEIHMDVGSNILLGHKNGLEINVQLPLHARYPPLDEGGYSTVEIGEPDLVMSCSREGKPRDRSCFFMLSNDTAKSRTVAWRIPSGIPAHGVVVSVFTFVSALLSTLLIVLTSLFCSGVKTI